MPYFFVFDFYGLLLSNLNLIGMKTTLLFLALVFFSSVSFAQPGTLDTTFDTDGKKYFGFATPNDYGEFVLIQSDNKILVGGRSSLTGGNLSFSLARMNSNGTFDNTFGTGGKVTTSYGTEGFEALSGALQPDGKIVVVGNAFINVSLGTSQVAVVRYNANGTLDTSFDTDGMVFTQISAANEDFGKVVKIQQDGKIIIAVQSKINFNWDFVLVRYNADGSLDNTFDSDGISRTMLDGNDAIFDIALQNDGKIVAVGYKGGASDDDILVARYNSNGSVDSSFGTAGFFAYDFASNHNYAMAVAITTEGKIIVGGRYQNGSGGSSPFVARLSANGTLDSTFDSDGILTLSTDEVINDIVLQSDDKILTFGTSNLKFGVWKLDTNGAFDATFGTAGKVETMVNINYCMGKNGTLQPDGKIVVVGDTYGSPFMKYGVVRYHNDAPLSTEIPVENTFVVYPNPSNGTLFIQLNTELYTADVSVYNTLGQQLMNFKMTESTQEINLKKGVYFVEMRNENNKVCQKVLVN